MIVVENKTNCCGCHACYNICPHKCISMIEDHEGFVYPFVDQERCINCNRCVDVCPIIQPGHANSTSNAYAAYNTIQSLAIMSDVLLALKRSFVLF